MGDDWDLHAVVRSCAAATTAAAAAENTPAAMELCPSNFTETVSDNISGRLGCAQPLSTSVDAPATTITTAAVTSISFGGRFDNEDSSMFGESISFSINPENSESINAGKRKKKKKKRVVELSEEGLSNDGWAWRKYGQKPIKGSPHPRNYYRCSTTKECLAKKQVEQSPTDTSKFFVSYSGDHLHQRPTHLSSLAGTTRSTRSNPTPLSSSSPPSASSFSPTTSMKEVEIGINDEDFDELIKNR